MFVRFARCNQKCTVETHGFDCDTQFEGGRPLTLEQLCDEVLQLAGACEWVLFTGGEPALQVDQSLVDMFHSLGLKCAIETNGSIDVSNLDLDWVCASPKFAEHTLKCLRADEVKYVLAAGQVPPTKPIVDAKHWLVSPAFTPDGVDRDALAWCIKWVKEHPLWRLSVQAHKAWQIR